MWSAGIVDWCFAENEILDIFKNISIPDAFLLDFKNRVDKLKNIRNLNESQRFS